MDGFLNLSPLLGHPAFLEYPQLALLHERGLLEARRDRDTLLDLIGLAASVQAQARPSSKIFAHAELVRFQAVALCSGLQLSRHSASNGALSVSTTTAAVEHAGSGAAASTGISSKGSVHPPSRASTPAPTPAVVLQAAPPTAMAAAISASVANLEREVKDGLAGIHRLMAGTNPSRAVSDMRGRLDAISTQVGDLDIEVKTTLATIQETLAGVVKATQQNKVVQEEQKQEKQLQQSDSNAALGDVEKGLAGLRKLLQSLSTTVGTLATAEQVKDAADKTGTVTAQLKGIIANQLAADSAKNRSHSDTSSAADGEAQATALEVKEDVKTILSTVKSMKRAAQNPTPLPLPPGPTIAECHAEIKQIAFKLTELPKQPTKPPVAWDTIMASQEDVDAIMAGIKEIQVAQVKAAAVGVTIPAATSAKVDTSKMEDGIKSILDALKNVQSLPPASSLPAALVAPLPPSLAASGSATPAMASAPVAIEWSDDFKSIFSALVSNQDSLKSVLSTVVSTEQLEELKEEIKSMSKSLSVGQIKAGTMASDLASTASGLVHATDATNERLEEVMSKLKRIDTTVDTHSKTLLDVRAQQGQQATANQVLAMQGRGPKASTSSGSPPDMMKILVDVKSAVGQITAHGLGGSNTPHYSGGGGGSSHASDQVIKNLANQISSHGGTLKQMLVTLEHLSGTTENGLDNMTTIVTGSMEAFERRLDDMNIGGGGGGRVVAGGKDDSRKIASGVVAVASGKNGAEDGPLPGSINLNIIYKRFDMLDDSLAKMSNKLVGTLSGDGGGGASTTATINARFNRLDTRLEGIVTGLEPFKQTLEPLKQTFDKMSGPLQKMVRLSILNDLRAQVHFRSILDLPLSTAQAAMLFASTEPNLHLFESEKELMALTFPALLDWCRVISAGSSTAIANLKGDHKTVTKLQGLIREYFGMSKM